MDSTVLDCAPKKCSTPYGIRGSPFLPFFHSLNKSECAQRLTASEVRHDSKHPDNLAHIRAQRLTASEVRHHPQTVGRNDMFCAQRLTASEVRHHITVDEVVCAVRCSTPYGIRGSPFAMAS